MIKKIHFEKHDQNGTKRAVLRNCHWKSFVVSTTNSTTRFSNMEAARAYLERHGYVEVEQGVAK